MFILPLRSLTYRLLKQNDKLKSICHNDIFYFENQEKIKFYNNYYLVEFNINRNLKNIELFYHKNSSRYNERIDLHNGFLYVLGYQQINNNLFFNKYSSFKTLHSEYIFENIDIENYIKEKSKTDILISNISNL